MKTMMMAAVLTLIFPAFGHPAGEILIPPAAGTLRQIGAEERAGLLAAMAAVARSGKWSSREEEQEYIFAPFITTAETPARVFWNESEVYHYSDGLAPEQRDALNASLYPLRFRARLRSDGHYALQWLQVSYVEIAADGSVVYASPAQLRAEDQRQLAVGVAAWSAWGREQQPSAPYTIW